VLADSEVAGIGARDTGAAAADTCGAGACATTELTSEPDAVRGCC
jgi:hypothetical protein